MAFLVLMTWIMLMTSILLLVGLWDLLHHYENRRKERNKRAILWFRPFISKLLLPLIKFSQPRKSRICSLSAGAASSRSS